MKKRLLLLPLMAISLMGCQSHKWICLKEGDVLAIYVGEKMYEYRLLGTMQDTKYYVEKEASITTIEVQWTTLDQTIKWSDYYSGATVSYKHIKMEYLK